VRIALLCPYSWTYPGGVTRHMEALAAELIAAGHEAKVLAPFDPYDATSKRLHRGASPEQREMPSYLVPLGRTIGLPANGAVSNLTAFPEAIETMRRELDTGGYDVLHIHEPIVPVIGWDAMCSTRGLPIVGTFHTYSNNALTNGAARFLGAGRRMNRLHVRIAVSEAAKWTAERFFGGRYRVIPNGVVIPHSTGGGTRGGTDGLPLPDTPFTNVQHPPAGVSSLTARPLRILFIGQAVERKGLPILLKAFEALRDHVPATLTLVGAGAEQVEPLLLDARGVQALGKVSDERKAHELQRADVLCAPSLSGESFGMVLTEAFAAATPVIASNITGYRDVARDGEDSILVPPGDPVALAEALREIALQPRRRARMARAARERAERFAWPHVAEEVLEAYEDAIAVRRPVGAAHRVSVRLGLAPSDLRPRVRPQRLPSLEQRAGRSSGRRALGAAGRVAAVAAGLAVIALALIGLQRIGVAKVIASIVSSQPGLVAAGLGLMCASMLVRGLAWHRILSVAPTWRPARRLDALQGTFIGVLMSATLPVRLGETSRALIVARRLGRARETLPVLLGTIVSQTLLNLLALTMLGLGSILSVDLLRGQGILVALALAPAAALLAILLAPALLARDGEQGPVRRIRAALSVIAKRLREGLSLFSHPRAASLATVTQLGAWGLQLAACWLLLMALGLDGRVGFGAAAAVLFAVNVTAFVPLLPANVGIFQAACVAVLSGAYHVSGPDALAYGIILQAVELATATVMGLPALVKEGLSWREVRLRTVHAAPVKLRPLPAAKRKAAIDSGLGG